ncbi:hypothetical protein Tco_0866684 [Tanacetum coccineum]
MTRLVISYLSYHFTRIKSVQKKTKKQLEQERLGHEEAIRLQEQINEEEIQRIARDAEIAKQLQEEFDRARERDKNKKLSFSKAKVRNNMCIYLKNQGGYKQSHFKGMKYEDIRPIFERVCDQNQSFVPKDSELEKEVIKRHGFNFQQKSSKKRSREDSDEDNAKKQILEDDAEKKELKDSMDVVPRDNIAIDVESLATKYRIVDWKKHVLTENMMYYQIIRGDESSKNYKIFSEMLDDFDRQDVLDLHILVQERYHTKSPEGYELLLWGDLKILFEPNEDDEIWKNQQDYNLISWRLFDSCGIHMLLMHTGIAIHMMIEKKYPLTQEMLSRMLSRRLEVDQESEMAFELLRLLLGVVDLLQLLSLLIAVFISIMDAPPSPNHVFNFPEKEFEEDPQDEPEEEFEENPEEDPKEELEAEAEEDAPPAATLPIAAPVVASGALEMPPTGSTFEVGGPSYVSPFPIFYQHGREILRLNDNTEILFNNVNYLERREKKRQAEIDANNFEIRKVKKRMNDFDPDLGDEVQFSNFVENRVAKLEDKDQEKTEKVEKIEKRLVTLETNYALVLSDRDGWKKAFYNLQSWVSERLGWGAMDTCPDDGVDGSTAFGESQPPKPPGSPSGSQ